MTDRSSAPVPEAATRRWRGRVDVAVVGAGPAGMATAISAGLRGLRVAVLERGRLPLDKPCGEGVLPRGVEILERLGVRAQLPADAVAPIRAIRYVQEDGTCAEGALAAAGLGIRRIALSEALRARAASLGSVEWMEGCAVRGFRRAGDGLRVWGDEVELEAGFLVAADGLNSPLRAACGLDPPKRAGVERFGARQHFARAPWTDAVEIHLSDGVEAYVTPCGASEVGVAFLFDPKRVDWGLPERSGQMPDRSANAPGAGRRHPRLARLLERFPALTARLEGARPSSVALGAGPFRRIARKVTEDRFALVGDAAGYVDALTGEGVALALESGWLLGQALPDALARGGDREGLAPYERAWRARFGRYARATDALVGLSRRPRLRRPLVRWLGMHPRALEWAIRAFAA